MKRRIILSAAVVFVVLQCTEPVNANSAQTSWQGTDTSGTAITDEECPVIVEHEDLTFTLPNLPDQAERGYNNRFTAEYTFVNPSDVTAEVLLSFPLGNEPAYYKYDIFDASHYHPERDDYEISADGKPIESIDRYTYHPWESFSITEELNLLRDDYLTDDFYKPDTEVYIYTFHFDYDHDQKRYTWVQADLPCDPDIRRYTSDSEFMSKASGDIFQIRFQLTDIIHPDDLYHLYVIGKPLDEIPSWQPEIETDKADCEFIGQEKISFEDYIFLNYEENSDISKVDYYNASVSQIQDTFLNVCSFSRFRLSDFLMHWKQYKLVFKPRQQIVNNVSGPAYPNVNTSYIPYTYEYTYLLTPASTWKSFGSLDITVESELKMLDSSIGDFTSTEKGYSKHLDTLPDQDLSFSLCRSTDPAHKAEPLSPLLLWYLILFGGPVILAAKLIHNVSKKNDKKE